MLTEKQKSGANYLRLVTVMRELRAEQKISEKEYDRAKVYYQKMTGADVVILD